MGDLSANFSRSEFACKCGCGFNTVDSELVEVLQIVSDHYSAPVRINSGARCQTHNEAVGGSAKSQHVMCRAADIQVGGVPPHQVADYIDGLFPDKYGLGRYTEFTHIDTRSFKARWGLEGKI